MSLFNLTTISQLRDTANAVIDKVKVKTDALANSIAALSLAVTGLNDEVDDIEDRFVYSTTEKAIGKWIDNTSDVYKITIPFTMPNSAQGIINIISIPKSIYILEHSLTIKISDNATNGYVNLTDAITFFNFDDVNDDPATVINLNIYNNSILQSALGQTGYCTITYIDTPTTNNSSNENGNDNAGE